MHNPSGQIQLQEVCWSRDELDVFPKEKMGSAYLVVFLLHRLYVFALLGTGERVFRPWNFKIARLMASGRTFILVVPMLASIYYGLNGTTNAVKPSYSRSFFPGRYLYGWVTHYFKTHHVINSTPSGPLMVRYCGSQTKHNNIGDARNLIHEGKIPNLL